MQRVIVLIGVILFCGCGNEGVDEDYEDPANLKQETSDFNDAVEIAESKNPVSRLSAWQDKLSKNHEYTQPTAGVFETERNEFRYQWEFTEYDVVLTVSEQPDTTDEEGVFLSSFVIELESEWAVGSWFVYEGDNSAAREACTSLQQTVIDEAIKLEESTIGAIHPDAYPESKAERLAIMKGPNHTSAMRLSYKALRGSGKELTGGQADGDVYLFIAAAEFNKDGTVMAKLTAAGK